MWPLQLVRAVHLAVARAERTHVAAGGALRLRGRPHQQRALSPLLCLCHCTAMHCTEELRYIMSYRAVSYGVLCGAVRDELGAGALQLLGGRRVLAAARVARRAHAARVARRARRRPLLAPLRSRALRSAPFRSQLFCGIASHRIVSLSLPQVSSNPIPSHDISAYFCRGCKQEVLYLSLRCSALRTLLTGLC